MFKYGSIRNFIVKFLVGIILFGFGLIYFTSLYSYSANDPGFSQLNYNINDSNIENLMGFFGAYLSSYSLIFIGTLSYLLVFFIILEGGKLFLGINSRFIILKFLSNLSGIILINVSIKSVNISIFKNRFSFTAPNRFIYKYKFKFSRKYFFFFYYKFFNFSIWCNFNIFII